MAKYWINTMVSLNGNTVSTSVPFITPRSTYLVANSQGTLVEYSKDGATGKTPTNIVGFLNYGTAACITVSANTSKSFVQRNFITDNTSTVSYLSGISDIANSIYDPLSDHIYICGRVIVSSQYRGFLAKLTPTGTIVWRKYFSIGATGTVSEICCVDNSSNVYVTATEASTSILKFNSSGTLVAQTTLSGTVSVYSMSYNVTDGYIYLARQTSVVRLTTALSMVDSTAVTGVTITGVTFDLSNNYYITGVSDSSKQISIIKFNSSSVRQWSNKINETFLSSVGYSIVKVGCCFDAVDNAVVLHAVGAYSSFNPECIAKLKSDGSGTGTYGTVSYASFTPTVTSGGVTLSTPSCTVGNDITSVTTSTNPVIYSAKGVTYVS